MKIVDLTLEITSDMISFPGYPMPTFIKWSKFETQGYGVRCSISSSPKFFIIKNPSIIMIAQFFYITIKPMYNCICN